MSKGFKEWKGSKAFKQSTSLRAEKYQRVNKVLNNQDFIANCEKFGDFTVQTANGDNKRVGSYVRRDAVAKAHEQIRVNNIRLTELLKEDVTLLRQLKQDIKAHEIEREILSLRNDNKALKLLISQINKRETRLGKDSQNVTTNHVRPNNGYGLPSPKDKFKAPKRKPSQPRVEFSKK